MNFKELLDVDLNKYTKSILPLRQGALASEYNSVIGDYSRNYLSQKNRIIPVYKSTITHGNHCYDRLLNYLQNIPYKTVLDLGCASGELLHIISKQKNIHDLYGMSICTGEVKYARDVYNLKNVIPGDMRNCDTIFNGYNFDIILLHCVLQFINTDERILLAKNINNLLTPNTGKLIVVDYRKEECSQMPVTEELLKIYNVENINNNLFSMGNITVFTKFNKN